MQKFNHTARKVVGMSVMFLLIISTPLVSEAAKMFEGVEINALIFRSSDTDYIMQELAPRLEEETGIVLKVDQVPYEEVRAKQLTDVAGAKQYDIINPCTEWSYEYRQFAVPLNEYIGAEGYPDIEEDDIIPFVWSEFNPEGIHWFPYQPDTRIFFYREDLLAQEGLSVPTTWDELLAAAEKLTKDTDGDGKIDQYGFVFPARRGWNLSLAWIPFLFSAGGDMFVDNKPAFNTQAGVDSLNLLLKLKQYGPPDIDTYGEYEVNQAVKNGMIAMGVSATAITPEIEQADSPIKGKVKSTIFPLQSQDIERKHTAILGGWALGVSAYSKHKDAAAYAVMWLTSKDIVTEMQINGRQHAARLSMAKNPELLGVNPHVSTIVDILSGSTLFFKSPQGAAVGELLNVRTAQAIAGDLAPQEALGEAVKDINTLLNQ
jgi:ABC-type glycerol-3-phosphate transport system substrate-binding protein